MFIFLILLLALLASSLSYPLWLFATHFQGAFSIAVTALLALLAAFLLVRQVKKHGIKSAATFSLKFFIVAAGLSLSVALVLSGRRIFALFALASAIFLFVLASKYLKPAQAELSSEK